MGRGACRLGRGTCRQGRGGLVVELSVECTGSWIMVNKQALGTTLKSDSYKLSSLIVAVYSFTAVLGIFTDD